MQGAKSTLGNFATLGNNQVVQTKTLINCIIFNGMNVVQIYQIQVAIIKGKGLENLYVVQIDNFQSFVIATKCVSFNVNNRFGQREGFSHEAFQTAQNFCQIFVVQNTVLKMIVGVLLVNDNVLDGTAYTQKALLQTGCRGRNLNCL